MYMAHSLGLIISITGIILASIGVIGESRLKNLEQYLQAKAKINYIDFLKNLWEETRSVTHFMFTMSLIFSFVLMVILLTMMVVPTLNIPDYVISTLFIITIGCGSVMLLPLLVGIIFILIVGISLPYTILSKIVEKTKIQSALVLLGIILSVLGLLVLEIT